MEQAAVQCLGVAGFDEDGIFAVDCFLKNRPQVILLDINMPGKNGWQALDAISKIDPLVPMIIITARPNHQGVASGRGVDALMEKPLDFELLLSGRLQPKLHFPCSQYCLRREALEWVANVRPALALVERHRVERRGRPGGI